MGDYSYESFKPHRLYLKQQLGSPVKFDENNKETFVELGIKGQKADGSPCKSNNRESIPIPEDVKQPGVNVQIS